jgi:hypothetical protein
MSKHPIASTRQLMQVLISEKIHPVYLVLLELCSLFCIFMRGTSQRHVQVSYASRVSPHALQRHVRACNARAA